MKCSRVEDYLPLYVSGELSNRVNRKVGLHLEACPRCHTQFDAYLALRTGLRVLRDEAAEGERSGFFEALEPRLPRVRTASRRASPPRWFRHAAVRSAAALLLVVAVGWMADPLSLRGGRGSPEPAPIGDAGALRSEMIVSQDVMNRPIGNVRPYVSVAVPSRSQEPDTIRPAVMDRDVWIMAGPRVSVPLEPPTWPVGHDAKQIQPYAWPATPPKNTSFPVY